MSKKCLGYLWALPVTLIGILLALIAAVTGGTVVVRNGVVEAFGGLIEKGLRGNRFFRGGAAMTLGHVILARDINCMRQSLNHEMKHVRQFERWGVLLLPMYWIVGIWLRLRGFDPYLDNPFEATTSD